MARHESKHCPRCNSLFECKPGNITQCQCYGISFTEEERQRMEITYADCLCSSCLIAIKNEMKKQS